MNCIALMILLAAGFPTSNEPTGVELTCMLLDSISGTWYSEQFSIAETTVDIPINIPQGRKSPCGQGRVGIDIRFENTQSATQALLLRSGFVSFMESILKESHASNFEQKWRMIMLLDSSLAVLRENMEPEIININGDPGYLSVSPCGSYALIYDSPEYERSEGMLTKVNLISTKASSLITEDSMYMSLRRFGCFVTDRGLIIVRRFRNGPLVYTSLANDSYEHWEMMEISDRLKNLPIATTVDYISYINETSSGLIEAIVLDLNGNIVSRFLTMRVYPKMILSPDGDKLIVSSELGVCIYNTFTGELVRESIYGEADEAPIVSHSGSFWACSFRSSLQYPDCGHSVIAGTIDSNDRVNIVLADYSEFWTEPRALAVSDYGDVLCVLRFDVPGYPGSIRRYILVDLEGNPLWMSEPLFPSVGVIQSTGNARGPFSSVLPKLADISQDGDRILLFDYSHLRIIELNTH